MKPLPSIKEYKQYTDKEGAQALFSGWTGVDLGKFDYDEELDKVESNAVRSFVEMWTKPMPGDPPNLKETRASIVDQLEIGGLGILIIGDPNEVADELIRWHEISGVDGFNFTYAVSPGSFEDLVDYVIPVLQEEDMHKRNIHEKEFHLENLYGVGNTF